MMHPAGLGRGGSGNLAFVLVGHRTWAPGDGSMLMSVCFICKNTVSVGQGHCVGGKGKSLHGLGIQPAPRSPGMFPASSFVAPRRQWTTGLGARYLEGSATRFNRAGRLETVERSDGGSEPCRRPSPWRELGSAILSHAIVSGQPDLASTTTGRRGYAHRIPLGPCPRRCRRKPATTS